MPNEDAFTKWYESAVIDHNGSKARVSVIMDRWTALIAFEAGWEANNLQPYEVWERD